MDDLAGQVLSGYGAVAVLVAVFAPKLPLLDERPARYGAAVVGLTAIFVGFMLATFGGGG